MILHDKNYAFFVAFKKIRHTPFVGQISSQKAAVLDNKKNSGPLFLMTSYDAELDGNGFFLEFTRIANFLVSFPQFLSVAAVILHEEAQCT